MPPQGAALRCSFKVGLPGYAVLVIGHLIAKGAEHLSEHNPGIRFQPVRPVGVAQAGKIEQSPAKAPKVAGRIVHGKINQVFGRALMGQRCAVRIRRAIGLEGKTYIIVKRIDAKVSDVQPV